VDRYALVSDTELRARLLVGFSGVAVECDTCLASLRAATIADALESLRDHQCQQDREDG
jgi:hypothetical protein